MSNGEMTDECVSVKQIKCKKLKLIKLLATPGECASFK